MGPQLFTLLSSDIFWPLTAIVAETVSRDFGALISRWLTISRLYVKQGYASLPEIAIWLIHQKLSGRCQQNEYQKSNFLYLIFIYEVFFKNEFFTFSRFWNNTL